MKNLLHFFKRKWCILDLSYVGGGYIGQTYMVKYPDDIFDQFQIASIELPHFAKAGYITSRAIIKRFYSMEKALAKTRRLIYGKYLGFVSKKPTDVGKLLAVCSIDIDEPGQEILTIVRIEYNQYADCSLNYFYRVVETLPVYSGDPPAHNLWLNTQSAENYKNTLECKATKPFGHHRSDKYVVRPYY